MQMMNRSTCRIVAGALIVHLAGAPLAWAV
jgi:hypothetical protein